MDNASFSKITSDRIGYEVTGDGPELVLVHGLGRCLHHWLDFKGALAQYFKVIAVDNRGIGLSASAKITLNASVYQFADDIDTVLNELNVEKAHFLGVSLGGMITLAFALKYPQKCLSLNVINSSIAESPVRLSARGILTLIKAKQDPQQQEEIMSQSLLTRLDEADRKKVARAMQLVSWEFPPDMKAFSAQLIAASKFFCQRKLKNIKVPVQVVVGTGDKFVPSRNSLRIHQHLPNSKLLEIENGGHELWLEDPTGSAKFVAAFTRALEYA